MNDTKEMTAPVTSVGADVGQPLAQSNVSITDEDAEYKKKLLEVQRFCDPMQLNTLSMLVPQFMQQNDFTLQGRFCSEYPRRLAVDPAVPPAKHR